MCGPTCHAAADVEQFVSLSRLTHMDLGRARGVMTLAPRLPALQSLVLDLRARDPLASAGLSAA
jgi:hypothetical protein